MAATPRATSTPSTVTGPPKTGGAPPIDQGTSAGLMLALAGLGAVVLGSGYWAYRRMSAK
jgi:hypothetical protein